MGNRIALISVDNIETFENPDLKWKELYVEGGEKVAEKTAEAIALMKEYYNALIVNVFESHPKGHISFASSYKDRKPFSTITLAEVESWTDNDHGLSIDASFTVKQLKDYLRGCPDQQDTLRPDHAMASTKSAGLMLPLTSDMFDLDIVKWDQVDKHPYGAFGSQEKWDDTGLEALLKEKGIGTVVLTGVATDFCLGQTAWEALARGFKVVILTDAIAGIDAEQSAKTLKDLKATPWVILTTVDQLKEAFCFIQ